MPRDGSITLGDLLGRVDWLDIVCVKCERHGRYRVHTLVPQRGLDCRIPDWVNDITCDCPRRRSPALADAGGATCPGLLEIR
jgi:hypothetical protein